MPPAANRSLLDTVESVFQALAADPNPLTLDGDLFGQDVLSRPVPVDEARSLLLECPETDMRDAVWRALVHRARSGTDRDAWLLAAVGVMLPGLRSISRKQAGGPQVDRGDLDSEAVAEFLSEMHKADPMADGLSKRLWWAAFRGAYRARRHDLDAVRHLASDLGESIPSVLRSPSHPDLALARLCEEKVISQAEGDLIGRTRIEGEPLAAAARRLGISYEACSKRRGRAERRVLEYLTRRESDPVPPGATDSTRSFALRSIRQGDPSMRRNGNGTEAFGASSVAA
ncbi:sigma-70 family RNA polymerase sigma factor [Streptomyces violascens]|uniref:Sigma-70 family RNA polymerase sigma factor n=1 Tax=Streptomyces violascens TaxID=67381 RepID=A0ABQ3QYJ6_9ACTN|nr:sigma-70 family RNA polymerase sigma factor [Streptomyces violascens]GGU22339.1 hypothetical protein GCM10010289_49790 [Streptomyces violascens]GHI42356.1 hypothetical protein Sviol_67640 [Streptomyces violascens]